jgi:hypothetical protein
MMKYAINHRYKFNYYYWSFLVGYFKAFACVTVELVSIFVICAADNIIEITMNFIALAVIADFDDYVFTSLQKESFTQLISDDFTRQVLKI